MDGLFALEPLSLSNLVVNMLLGARFSAVIAWYHARFGEVLSNRFTFARLRRV